MKYKNELKISFIWFISTAVFILPFLLKIKLPFWGIDFSSGLFTLFSNYDGPNYLVITKSLYDPDFIRLNFSLPQPLEYYPAHLPLYPLLIKILDLVIPGPVAMIAMTLIGSLVATLAFYRFVSELKLSRNPMWLTFVFMFLPARWLLVRNIGSPEPWFIAFIILSIYFFYKRKYFWAGIFGVLAQWTKSPGILLFAGYILYMLYVSYNASLDIKSKMVLLWEKLNPKKKLAFYVPSVKKWLFEFAKLKVSYWPIWLIPISVIPLFSLYAYKTGDFFAYFNSGDNFHLFLPPFSIFAPKGQFWVGEFWLEDVIFTWLIFGLGTFKLLKKRTPEAFFSLIFFASTLFVAHRDVSRYILPIFPFMLIAYKKILSSKEFRWIFMILLIPIYLFAWNFALNNTTPVADWTPYL